MSASLENKPELPVEFLSLVKESLGEESLKELLHRLESGRSLTAVRLNPHKYPLDERPGNLTETERVRETMEEMRREGAEAVFGENVAGRIPWCETGFYLKERPQFTLDPLFHAGAYYVQEASSMYMDLLRDAIERECNRREESGFFTKSLTVLDLCAAPGGKTTHLASFLNDDSLLIANEVIKSRSVILADNVAKWGNPRVMVTRNDPRDFEELGEVFDLVVADVPCSGEGLFGKEPGAVREWSLSNVKLCSERQQRILADIWPVLKPGGFLIYSTCTYNHFENDDNLGYLQREFGAQPVRLEPPAGSGVLVTPGGGLQFVPGRVEGEGQFVALLRKPEAGIPEEIRSGKRFTGGRKEGKAGKWGKGEGKGGGLSACPFIPDGYDAFLQGELLIGLPQRLTDRILFFKERLQTVLSGVAIASVKGRDFIPHPDLALLAGHACTGIPAIELSREDALRFLAKDPLAFPESPVGYLRLTYRGRGLGFVKNLGSRSNNLLPMARRIRMDVKL